MCLTGAFPLALLEGSLYEPLFHMATNRCYPTRQRPIMMTVTSSGDAATATAFPFGRSLSTLFESSKKEGQPDSILRTVGHNVRYRTHELEWSGPLVDASGTETVSRAKCDCTLLAPTAEFHWWEFVQDLQSRVSLTPGARGAAPQIKADATDGKRRYQVYGKNVVLVGDPKYVANYPYLVVRTSPAIIPDHNSIYTEPFIRFLHSFFILHIAYRHTFEGDGCFAASAACMPGGVVPCEQSCRLSDGGSCSGRRTDDVPTRGR